MPSKINVQGSFTVERRPTKISTIRVTPVNRDAIASWIREEWGHYTFFDQGVLHVSRDPEYPDVYLVAYVGDYLVLDSGTLKAYSHRAFWEKYYTP